MLPRRLVRLVCVAALAAACNQAQVNSGKAGAAPERPGGSGGSGGPATGGPGVSLPDASSAPAAPDVAPAQCAAETHKAESAPLDLMLLLDSSGSMMGAAGTRTKWQTAQAALSSFVSDPKSAGLNVGLQFFPPFTACTTDGDCLTGAPDRSLLCSRRQVCAGAAGPTAQRCGPPTLLMLGQPYPACPGGTTCQPLGVCTGNGQPCTNAGEACPMGGGMCDVPPKSCVVGGNGDDCQEARYQTPAVPIQVLPTGQFALTRMLTQKLPLGGTPLGPAVRGVLDHLRARLMADPARKAALVVTSDGLPDGCERNDVGAVAADLAAAFGGAPSIPTYMIGVFTVEELAMARPQLDMLAQSGGTKQAFLLTAGEDLNMRLLDALNQIRGAVLACEYRIPAGTLDFGKVNVRHTSPAGPQNIPYVETMNRCDPMRGGWYYDVPPSAGTPTRIIVCPATCASFTAEKSAQVDLVFGCATQRID
jgi:Mg-chelatase subunit ChlD